MKKTLFSILSMSLLSPISLALAASGRSDNSGFVVWVFLGFCGLIVAAQLIPALLVMFGLVKGAAGKHPELAKEKAH